MTAHCYVLTGPMGSGKTTVLAELAALGYRTVPEAAREVIAQQRALDPVPVYQRDPALFVRLMLETAVTALQDEARATQPVFFDRGIPDVVGHFGLSGNDPAHALEVARHHRYNRVVFALGPWPEIYTTDGDRRMTVEQAEAFGRRVLDVYLDLGYEIVEVPRAPASERARLILERVIQDGAT